jgi:hypothetical protein
MLEQRKRHSFPRRRGLAEDGERNQLRQERNLCRKGPIHFPSSVGATSEYAAPDGAFIFVTNELQRCRAHGAEIPTFPQGNPCSSAFIRG